MGFLASLKAFTCARTFGILKSDETPYSQSKVSRRSFGKKSDSSFLLHLQSDNGRGNSTTFKSHRIQMDLGKSNGNAFRSIAASTSEQVSGLQLSTRGQYECFEVEHCMKLSGHVHISGAKNSALAVLAGAVCSEKPLILRRIPHLHDVKRMLQVLQSLGVKTERGIDGPDSIMVDASHLTSVEPNPDVVRKLRASFFVFGAIMGRMGEAVVPLPGGCNIGARPIDLHVRGLEALGAEVSIRLGISHCCFCKGFLTVCFLLIKTWKGLCKS